ncbi:antitoxin VbhA family protein [Sphingomonas sp. LB2R24]|uniref:antitoxin VbhA family protein n=1 Tax=Sphingomonas sorbitolis TaxID=3096165 RepID=UPI002FCAB7A5
MNVVTPFTSSTPAISEAERARRLSEVNFARGSVRYEGGVLSDEIEQLNARYIAGEIDSDELTAAILASDTVRAA